MLVPHPPLIGGMVTFFAVAAGFPLPLAALIALVAAVLVGVLLHRLAIEPAKGASPVTLWIVALLEQGWIRHRAAVAQINGRWRVGLAAPWT